MESLESQLLAMKLKISSNEHMNIQICSLNGTNEPKSLSRGIVGTYILVEGEVKSIE